MDEQAMQPKAKEPKTQPKIEATLFVPDPALEALYRQAVAMARAYGWTVPVREEFEQRYREEIAASRKKHE